MNKIVFDENYNNKLNNKYFTTVRLWSQEKEDYYEKLVGKEFSVFLKGEFFCKAKLIGLFDSYFQRIMESCPFFSYLDAGLNQDDFFVLMERMYSNKKEWKDEFTNFLILLFERDDVELLSASDIYYSIPSEDKSNEFDKKKYVKVI